MADWVFASGKQLTIRGLNDGDVDGFKGAPVISLAREICQNSVDAKSKKEVSKDKTVRIVFSSFAAELPGRESLLSKVKAIRNYWAKRQKSDKRIVEFFDRCIKMLQNDTVSYLRISDFNTTGLCGIGEEGSTWDNLITSVGVSDKGSTDGGSKGIGHAASFACTDLQTVFYSTINEDAKGGSQGVSRLAGWEAEGLKYENIGYYGEGEEHTPLNSCASLDPSFQRSPTETGTDIYIAGFNRKKWDVDIVRSAIDSFLVAFFENKLELLVGGHTINQEKLGEAIAGVINDRGADGFRAHADQYYKVLTSTATREFFLPVEEAGRKGRFKLRLLIDSNLTCRKVAMVRDTGMLIYEQANISGTIPFAGILEVEGVELNAFLRSLENAQHTEWSAARDVEHQQQTEDFLLSIRKFIRTSLLSMTQIKEGETIDSGLGDTLPLHGDKNDENTKTEDIDDAFEPLTVRPPVKKEREKASSAGKRKKRRRRPSEDEEKDENGGGSEQSLPMGEEEGKGGAGDASHSNLDDTPDGEGGMDGLGKSGDTPVVWRDCGIDGVRTFCTSREQSRYRVRFTPGASYPHSKIKVFTMAETSNYNERVLSASLPDGSALAINDKGEIEGLELKEGEPLELDIQLNYNGDYCSLDMEAYGHS